MLETHAKGRRIDEVLTTRDEGMVLANRAEEYPEGRRSTDSIQAAKMQGQYLDAAACGLPANGSPTAKKPRGPG